MKTNALKYSNKDKNTIIRISEEFFFLVNNLAKKNDNPQKIANMLGSKITAIGIK